MAKPLPLPSIQRKYFPGRPATLKSLSSCSICIKTILYSLRWRDFKFFQIANLLLFFRHLIRHHHGFVELLWSTACNSGLLPNKRGTTGGPGSHQDVAAECWKYQFHGNNGKKNVSHGAGIKHATIGAYKSRDMCSFFIWLAGAVMRFQVQLMRC